MTRPGSRYRYTDHILGHCVVEQVPYRDRRTGGRRTAVFTTSAVLTAGGTWRVTEGGISGPAELYFKARAGK